MSCWFQLISLLSTVPCITQESSRKPRHVLVCIARHAYAHTTQQLLRINKTIATGQEGQPSQTKKDCCLQNIRKTLGLPGLLLGGQNIGNMHGAETIRPLTASATDPIEFSQSTLPTHTHTLKKTWQSKTMCIYLFHVDSLTLQLPRFSPSRGLAEVRQKPSLPDSLMIDGVCDPTQR
jgi:hypothetical protein